MDELTQLCEIPVGELGGHDRAIGTVGFIFRNVGINMHVIFILTEPGLMKNPAADAAGVY